jgi:hypothetical protein
MWEAANAPTAVPRDDNRTTTSGFGGLNLNGGNNDINSLQQDHRQNQNHHHHQHQNQNQNRPQHGDNNRRSRRVASSETIEAALSRLSKAYTTSIECIGAISKTNQMILQQKRREKIEAKGKRNFETLGDGNNQHQNNSADTATILSALETIKKVSNIARTTLETAILLDPLMLPHVPILHQSMIELSNNDNPEANNKCRDAITSPSTTSHPSRWNAVKERRPAPPTISSAAHKSTLVQLAYLSLVNYSDLLQQSSGSTTPMNAASKRSASTPTAKPVTILDRGIVPRLKSFEGLTATKTTDDTNIIDATDENNNTKDHYNNATTRHQSSQLFSCWIPEDPEETQRLAVAALCDASNLDGTDPVTWLKLACASRRLERIVAEGLQQNGEIMTTVERSQHRQLQRRALERGSIALPKHMPPNRTVLRALEEFYRGPEIDEYHSGGLSTASTRTKVCKKTMELTRYSWSVLGKMIIRACKGEEFTAPWDTSSSTYNNNNICDSPLSLFGSPTVVIQLSPMLVLPSKVLGKICQYLENSSIWKFEATCRALSVNIIAARASMEESESNHDDDDNIEHHKIMSNPGKTGNQLLLKI